MLVVSHARRIFTHRLRIHRLHRIRKFHPHRPRHRSRRPLASNLFGFLEFFLYVLSRAVPVWILGSSSWYPHAHDIQN